MSPVIELFALRVYDRVKTRSKIWDTDTLQLSTIYGHTGISSFEPAMVLSVRMLQKMES
jgi:hypothetical protein